MRRYWIDHHIQEAEEIEIDGDLFHHICGVCRQDIGSKFELLNEGKKAYLVEIVAKGKKVALARVLESRDLPELKKPLIRLCISMPKFSTFETILEKSVELGIHRVQPFFSDYSFVREANKISPSRRDRWNKIVKSACEQTGRSPLMTVEETLDLKPLLQEWNSVTTDAHSQQVLGPINRGGTVGGLFLYEGCGRQDLVQILKEMKSQNLQEVWIFIGSEGGFSDKEVELFQSVNMPPVSLGEQVLRVETACLAVTSIIKYGLNLF